MNNLSYESYEIIKFLYKNNINTQRIISNNIDISLGKTNNCINELINNGYINKNYRCQNKTNYLIECNKPKNAIILAAGVGLRMIPVNHNIPKALLSINNEILIERLIVQLKEVGIYDIKIVVGYMKEKFEYLIDKYNVELIVNDKYFEKNNYYSLYKALKYVDNTYIIPADLYFIENPFNKIEIESWYMISQIDNYNGGISLNNKHHICKSKKTGCRMVGLSYINHNDSILLKNRIIENINKYENNYWEEALFINNKMFIYGMVIDNDMVKEINTFEELKELDDKSPSLNDEVLNLITTIFNVSYNEIKNITCLKKGMTNRSFLFEVNYDKYIMRIPGEGTDLLINRSQESSVYDVLKGKDICDNVVYFNSDNGYKITSYINNSRNCNPYNQEDLIKCMKLLKKLHNSDLKVNHYFDIFERIEYYEKLRNTNSLYGDYLDTKNKMYELKKIIDSYVKHYTLTHIDAVPDNFLIYHQDKKEEIRLIDWEYASMQDSDVDIAMFCIYSLYKKDEVDNLINIYYENNCDFNTRIKIYCYIAICGFLWSNWCEYKYTLGVEFGEYSLAQYRYAKDYYKIVMGELKCMK